VQINQPQASCPCSFATVTDREPVIKYKGRCGKPSRSSKTPVMPVFRPRKLLPSCRHTFPLASCVLLIRDLYRGESFGLSAVPIDANFLLRRIVGERNVLRSLTKHSVNYPENDREDTLSLINNGISGNCLVTGTEPDKTITMMPANCFAENRKTVRRRTLQARRASPATDNRLCLHNPVNRNSRQPVVRRPLVNLRLRRRQPETKKQIHSKKKIFR